MPSITVGNTVTFRNSTNRRSGVRAGTVVRGVVTNIRYKNSRRRPPHYVASVAPLTGNGGAWTVPIDMLTLIEGPADADILTKTEAAERVEEMKERNKQRRSAGVIAGFDRIKELNLKVGDKVVIRGRPVNWTATVGKLNMATGKVGLTRRGNDNEDLPEELINALFGRRRNRREFRWVHPRCILRKKE